MALVLLLAYLCECLSKGSSGAIDGDDFEARHLYQEHVHDQIKTEHVREKTFLKEYDERTLLAAVNMQKNKPFVNKTVGSTKHRLIFLAGLQGSGFSLWTDILKDCKNAGQGCKEAPALAAALWFDSKTKVSGLFLEEQKLLHSGKKWTARNHTRLGLKDSWLQRGQYNKQLDRVRAALKAMKKGSGISYVNGVGSAGLLSYPNWPSSELQGFYRFEENAIFDYPDLATLARLCEEQGIDFRVVYLHRNHLDMHASVQRIMFGYKGVPDRNWAKHGFEHDAWRSGVHALEFNARVLSAQLGRLDKEFILCSDYDHLVKATQLPEVFDEFLKPQGANATIDFTNSLDDHLRVHEQKKAQGPEEDPYMSHLERSVNQLYKDGYCSEVPRR